MITAKRLSKIEGVRHGFFSREGGVSEGIYASRNTGLGSGDKRERVKENRRLVCQEVGGQQLYTPHQIHSSNAVLIEDGWDHDAPDSVPRADAVIAEQVGKVAAVNTADCTPILFASADGTVVAATHAGWKGAIGGVLEATVEMMRGQGAKEICAAIGPTISQANYEVGPEFRQRFLEHDKENERYFIRSKRPDHYMFDLPAYVSFRLERLDLEDIEDVGLCTYADEVRFFSYRRTTHLGEANYGRQLSAITITA